MKKSKKLFSTQNLLSVLLIGLLLAWSSSPRIREWIRGLVSPRIEPGDLNSYPEVKEIREAVLAKNGTNKLAKMLAAKAFIETGRFTSSVYRNNNNAFGMKCPTKRKTLMTRCLNGYAYFVDIMYSVSDYFLWWEYHKKSVASLGRLSLYELLEQEKKYNYYTTDIDSYYKKVKWFYDRL